jgi:hypothetical protein
MVFVDPVSRQFPYGVQNGGRHLARLTTCRAAPRPVERTQVVSDQSVPTAYTYYVVTGATDWQRV